MCTICSFFEVQIRNVLYVAFLSTLEPTCKVHGYKVFLYVRSVFARSQSEIPILANNPDIWSIFIGQNVDLTSGLECIKIQLHY